MSEPQTPKLKLNFHGRIIDSLGIQMYQSPVAAIAELIANAWDADANSVDVSLPSDTTGQFFSITDDGSGMTFEECQNCYLNVGRNRRLSDGETTSKGRALLGRKGIGKFAGFGIARVVEIDTVSYKTGERTVFKLDLAKLRSDEFVNSSEKEIEVLIVEGPDEARKARHGTTIRLRELVSERRPPVESFLMSMARRFVLAAQADKFRVKVNGKDLPPDVSPIGNKIEFQFPTAYAEAERPPEITLQSNGWARETIGEGEEIEWQIRFTEKPIGEEEFRGVAVYCGVKLAQTPFFFQLSGGLSGQHGQQYMTGRVRADYLDQMGADIITTERQRINWEDETAQRLLTWGQDRIKRLLAIWQERRAAEKIQKMDQRLASFSKRIERLKPSEAKVVRRALLKIASIASIDQMQFDDLASAVLTAWEGGRLRDIIEEVSRVQEMDAGVLVSLLTEHDVLTALHVAEAVRLKLDVVDGLRRRIAGRELENAVRDYIAGHPWLISPYWETFQVERRIDGFLHDALQESGIADDPDWSGRVDLALSSGGELLIVEFMRPGLTVDRAHVDRFQRYVDIIRPRVESNTGLKFQVVTGLLVADRLHTRPDLQPLLKRLADDRMECVEWSALLSRAEAQWKDFLFALSERSPEDDRVRLLLEPRDKQ